MVAATFQVVPFGGTNIWTLQGDSCHCKATVFWSRVDAAAMSIAMDNTIGSQHVNEK